MQTKYWDIKTPTNILELFRFKMYALHSQSLANGLSGPVKKIVVK